ncbi:hypothetical protein [Atribacter sp.]
MTEWVDEILTSSGKIHRTLQNNRENIAPSPPLPTSFFILIWYHKSGMRI